MNKKFIGVVIVIVVLAVIACLFAYRSGVVSGIQSASVNKALDASAAIKTGVTNEAKVGRLGCWYYGGTWTEFPGHKWDCKWLTVSNPANNTK